MKWLARVLVVLTCATQWACAQETPKRTIFFAFFANGPTEPMFGGLFPPGLQTDFTFINPGQKNARVTLRFFSNTGMEVRIPLLRSGSFPVPTMSDNSFDLPAKSSSTVSTVPESQLLSGWVRIESTEAVTALESINRVLISTQFQGIVRPSISEVAVPSSTPVPSFALSVTENLTFGSGIAIASPESGSTLITGRLTLFDPSGSPVASRQVTLNPRGQLSLLASELFPGFTVTNGTIAGEFEREVIVTSLKFGKTVRLFSMGVNLVSGTPVD